MDSFCVAPVFTFNSIPCSFHVFYPNATFCEAVFFFDRPFLAIVALKCTDFLRWHRTYKHTYIHTAHTRTYGNAILPLDIVSANIFYYFRCGLTLILCDGVFITVRSIDYSAFITIYQMQFCTGWCITQTYEHTLCSDKRVRCTTHINRTWCTNQILRKKNIYFYSYDLPS